MSFSLGKQERLKSKKLIGELFTKGKSLKAFPLRMVYLQTEHTSNYPAQVAVSVPKRNFKKAVDRNKIKRLLRESYRLEKQIVYSNLEKPYVFMISYLAKDEWSYEDIQKKMIILLNKLIEEIKKNEK